MDSERPLLRIKIPTPKPDEDWLKTPKAEAAKKTIVYNLLMRIFDCFLGLNHTASE